MANYESFYGGTPYSLEPTYGNFIGYSIQAGKFGLTTDVRTANKIQEVTNKLNTGIKEIEISAISPEIFESIPQQHLKEINRLSKLTGSETTVHMPMLEPSGYTREGWSETNRVTTERQMKDAVERVHELDPKGNIVLTFHSSAMLPAEMEKIKEKVEGEEKIVPKSMLIVEPRTGDIKQIKETEKYFPGERGVKFEPEKELEKRNKEIWTENLGQINFYALRGEETIRQITEIPEIMKKHGLSEETIEKISPQLDTFKRYAESREKTDAIKNLPLPEKMKEDIESQFRVLDHASIFLKDAYRGLKDLYNMAYKNATEEDRKKLDAYYNDIKPLVEKGVEADKEQLKEFAGVIEKGIKVLDSMKAPQIYQPLNKFLYEKSAETFANTALDSYKKFGVSSPIISIENPPVGAALSRAEELQKLIEKTRDKFVEQAKKEGISESEARDAAKKIIGATWDVGHINMLRKYGYDKADLIKETEKIAPYVKHVHLSDNFGFEHTELPMGMGNVPIKEIMEKLGKEGFEGKKIIEAGQWWQHFKTPPLVPTLEAFGSPLYPMLAQPTWNQIANTYGGYFALPSAYFPEQHFSMYGGGFATLPVELGGQIPGKQGRFAGTPNE